MKHTQLLSLLLLGVLLSQISSTSGAKATQATAAKQYEIVPCLLPARIRKLGNLVYPERRRLVESSALECGLKGGEYTYYDRAAPESAVAFFSSLAADGNGEAQVSLGDVYQYLFEEPRYEQAAHWYQLASENGIKAGMMRLAQLYERGTGVAQDELMATNLWREATGAGEELVLASELDAARTAADERIAGLTDELQTRNEEADTVRRQLEVARADIGERQSVLAAAEAQLRRKEQRFTELERIQTNTTELTGLRTQLAQQRRTIEDQRYDIASLQGNLGVQEAQLKANLRQVELQNRRLQRELAMVSSKADEELGDALAKLDAKGDELDALKGELVAARSALQSSDSEYGELLADLEQARGDAQRNSRAARKLEKLKAEQTRQLELLNEQRRQIASLEGKVSIAQSEAGNLSQALEQQIHQKEEVEALFAQAEAELNTNREELASRRRELSTTNERVTQLQVESTQIRRQLAASTSAADDTSRLTVALNAKNVELSERASAIRRLETEVDMFRSLLEENRKQREQYVTMRSPIERLPDTSKIRLPRNLKLGTYYALVVGNSNYEHLPDLKNANNDARAMQKMLTDEYNFKTKLLLDATREEFYAAANEMRGKVGADDLVLFYYAGHGYETKNDSYWLPVETEQDIASYERQGVSSDIVSRWIKTMPARHVLIIADSCYSGRGIEKTGGVKWNVQDLELQLPFYLENRSRTMLTSGGNQPVPDGDGQGGEHSVFTKELLGLLEENKGVLHGEALHAYLLERVKYRARGFNINQSPQFGMIKSANHESGQFVFIHRKLQG